MIEMGWRAALERESRLDWYVRLDPQRGGYPQRREDVPVQTGSALPTI